MPPPFRPGKPRADGPGRRPRRALQCASTEYLRGHRASWTMHLAGRCWLPCESGASWQTLRATPRPLPARRHVGPCASTAAWTPQPSRCTWATCCVSWCLAGAGGWGTFPSAFWEAPPAASATPRVRCMARISNKKEGFFVTMMMMDDDETRRGMRLQMPEHHLV